MDLTETTIQMNRYREAEAMGLNTEMMLNGLDFDSEIFDIAPDETERVDVLADPTYKRIPVYAEPFNI